MKEPPQIFAFYSFKGGVGRSMAVLNVAYALAAKGRHVLVLDMDLEAPGLSGFLHRKTEIAGFAECDMVDLVRWASSASLPLDRLTFPPSTNYVVTIPSEKMENIPRVLSELGHLDIIPVEEERDYYERLTSLAMGAYDQEALIRTGSVLRAWLKSLRFAIDVPDYYGPEYERSTSYDYVLVDSRTGITETGGLCIGPLSDQLIVLTALNDQNVQGTYKFLAEVGIIDLPQSSVAAVRSIPERDDSELRSKPCLIVASLVPTGEIQKKAERLQQLEMALGKVVVKLSYHPQLALMETIFTRDHRDEYLAHEYEGLLLQLLRMADDGVDDDLAKKLSSQSRSSSEFREALSRLLRSAWMTGWGPYLSHLLLTLNSAQILDDAEYVIWDRVYRLHLNGKQPFRWAIANNWANLLSQWSQNSKSPELAELRLAAAMIRYDQILQAEDASPDQKALALFNRGVIYGQRGELEKAIPDYTSVIQMAGAFADQKAMALVNRGVTWGLRSELERAVCDYTSVIQMPDAAAEQKIRALLCRGAIFHQLSEAGKAIADYTSAIKMEGALPADKARALYSRAQTYGQQGELIHAIDDCTAAIQMPDAPVEQKVRSLLFRGATYSEQGVQERAIDDYSALIQMPDAAAEIKTQALFGRGLAYDRHGDVGKAITDYTAIIEMPDAPPVQKATALGGRGWMHYLAGRYEKAADDDRQPSPSAPVSV